MFMKKMRFVLIFITGLAILTSCKDSSPDLKSIGPDVLRDKIAGGWAGKMIGVTYGAPTEFRAQGNYF